jgi:multidrug transporter EmrE-like cation transporter
MRLTLIALILVSVLLSAGSQVLLKYGMTSGNVRGAIVSGNLLRQVLPAVSTSPYVLLGLGCFGLSALVWLFVLAKIPLSSAYPFVALGIAITVIAGRVLFGEMISVSKAVGVVVILAGIVTVAASP